MLVWLDLETTGLDPEDHVILELGMIVTDDDLNEQAHVSWIVKPGNARYLKQMNDFVRGMHTKNKLLEKVMFGAYAAEVEQSAIKWLETQMHGVDHWQLAGSSIHFDRAFLRRHMSLLEARFHYRMIDVSSFKEMVRRWMPCAFEARPTLDVTHRVIDDCRDSIAELAYYRDVLFGPTE